MEQFKVGDEAILKHDYFGIPKGTKVKIVKDDGTSNGCNFWIGTNGFNTAYDKVCVATNDLSPINSNQTNMDELKITKQRVLDAAARCGTAKATLETLFPEAFQSANCIPLEKQVFKSINGDGILTTPCWREGYENLIALNDRYDYKLTMGPRGLSQYLRVTPK